MIELEGVDLWEYPADVRVITTNGDVNSKGQAVMGRGCAYEAATRYPTLSRELANRLRAYGNIVHYFSEYRLFTFPVKKHWKEMASKSLIERSAHDLVDCVSIYPDEFKTVIMPRPGCGNGGLSWEKVRDIIEPILDDRFVVVTK